VLAPAGGASGLPIGWPLGGFCGPLARCSACSRLPGCRRGVQLPGPAIVGSSPLGSVSLAGGGGVRRGSAAAVVTSQRVDDLLGGFVRDVKAPMMAEVACGVPGPWLGVVLGASWTKASTTVTPMGAAFPVEGVTLPNSGFLG
jgi:hypothetical protein